MKVFEKFGIKTGGETYATRLQIEKLYEVPKRTLADNINALKDDGLVSGAKIRHTAKDGKKLGGKSMILMRSLQLD